LRKIFNLPFVYFISNLQISSTDEASDDHFNEGKITQHIVTYATVTVSKIISEI